MASLSRTAKSIFLEAVEKYQPEQWDVFLDGACGDDAELRLRAEDLLKAHEGADSLLDASAATVDLPAGEVEPGTMIGRYKLLQQIGEGGFGVVFMAEQQQPVRRKVALKVIKPGMDSKAVVGRFESERQALAMMDHPNIARVYDGGATESGRPYFVMELVKGVPITEYCDKNQLPTDERLKLFMTVCQAVQHAHQKGIIHRDLKPSNVLVTLADGQPVVKVIDFGVAKATNQQLTEKTLFTAFGQMIGTPQYMSPEQAEMSCLDVDTRSDVYSLGVLLYELLTGSTPLEAKQLRTAGYAEMQRLIREEEPLKPSTRLSTSGDQLTIIAKHRSVSPERLKSQVKGDLDWIVMKALEKDRNRRYESPNELAKELNRFLLSEPVIARPPTIGYRITKYIKRHRAAIATVSVLLLSLSAGLLSTLQQKSVAIAEAERANQILAQYEETLGELRIQLLDKALMYAMDGQVELTRSSIEDARLADIDSVLERVIVGEALLWQGKPKLAEQQFIDALAIAPDSYAAAAALALTSSVSPDPSDLVRVSQQLSTLKPHSAYDRILGARSNAWISPSKSIDLLKGAAELQDTSFYRWMELSTLSNLSFFDPDSAHAASAAVKISDLHKQQKRNAITLTQDLYTRLACLHETRRRGREVSGQQLESARSVVQQLEPYRDAYFAGRTRAWFLGDFGSPDELVAEWRHRIDADPLSTDFVHLAACYYQHGRASEALAVLTEGDNKTDLHSMIARAQLMSTISGNAEAIESLCTEILKQHHSPYFVARVIEILVSIGNRDVALELAKSSFQNEDVPEHCRKILRFLETGDPVHLGTGIESQGTSTDSLIWEFNPDYLVGIDALGRGEDGVAKERFERCVETGVFPANWYWWAKAYLATEF